MPRRERDWFHKMAPKGFRIRMMEPGEAEALLAIRGRATAHPSAPRDEAEPIGGFVAWLLQHEVFVAATKAGEPIGFAVARDLGGLYWLAGLYMLPEHGRRGVGRALLGAVTARAGWFLHRALGLSTARATAPFFEAAGFAAIPPQDFAAILDARWQAEYPPKAAPDDRLVLVKAL